MKDRLKFRVWHKKRKRMYEVLHLHMETWSNEGEWVTAKGFNIITQQDIHIQIESKDGVIMQSTGLRDKNGKLIFDGDIIVIPNQYPFYDYKNKEDMKQNLNETHGEIKGESILNYVGIVENIYSSWQYVYHCVNPKKSGISEGINHLLNEVGYEEGAITDFEVIGNIYENPELIEVENESKM